ncbi:CD109 antigen [Hypsibius exemplaris]|uniref:TEP1-F n=1 Tax=Hypsibius exemplaris TaxID=2072580 RepID=A0A1W0WV32_HYPEX|nr:CD109 antigen [Hypsibius exemplaris]
MAHLCLLLVFVCLLGGTYAQSNSSDLLIDLVQDLDFTPPSIIYYVTSPRTIRTFRDYPVSVTIQNASSPVTVNIQLVETFYLENDTIVAEASGIVQPGSTQKFILKIKALGKSSGRVYMRGQSQVLRIRGQDQQGNNFTDESSQITVERKNNLIFVQTDKPLYKLGDSVKFRVVVVDVSLKPSSVPLDIKIYDPQRNLIQQHLQVNGPNASLGASQSAGFFAAELQLASEAPLGSWSIEITSPEEETTRKDFSVEEYVLPRFDVQVKAPAYIIALQDSFEITLSANYTFGQPVKGKAYVQVDGPGKWQYELRREVRLSRNYTFEDFNGTQKIKIFVGDVVNRTEDFTDWNSISITANVTEGTTSVNRKAALASVSMKRQPYKLDIVKSTNNFKPGFPYTVYVTATQHDGRPIPPTTKRMIVKISSSGSAFSRGYFDDELNNFAVPANGTVTVTIIPAKETRNIFFTARLGKVTASSSIGGFDSPSNSFMQIYPNSKNISVGDQASFDLRLTNPFSLLNYTIVSKGQVITENSVFANGTSATVVFPVTQLMAPRARLLAYYMRPDSEVVANVIDFEVAGLLQNNITVSVRPENRTEYAEPGESTLVRVQTAPNSFVGMLAMDQSLLLLKTGNDFTESDVISAVQGFEVDSWSFDDAFGSSRFKFPDGRSVWRFLEQAGLIVLSNAAIPGNPKNPDVTETNTVMYGGAAGYGGGGMQMAMAAPAMDYAAAPSSAKRTTSRDGGDAPRVRKDFSETFLYEAFPVGPSGSYEFRRQVPDTITSWVCSAFSLNNDVGLGITRESSKLKVFRPFFAVLNLPFAIVRGETANLEVLVFNYLDQDQDVTVTLEIHGQDKSGNRMTAEPRVKKVTVKSQDSVSVGFPVKPEVVGDMEIKATAVSDMAGDSLMKKLTVRPEGIRQQFNAPLFVDLRKEKSFSADVLIPLPKADIVPGSEKLVFSAIGDLLGPTIYGIDSLINLPYGCGEQNMALFAPNVFVMKYLLSANRLDEDNKRKLIRNLRSGYQRQLLFKHYDKSYSAFGDSDPSGSTFLTAFVARSFYQAKDFITIDKEVISGAVEWLVNRQAENGSFPEVGKVFDRELQGGAGKGTALTAYVLITLLETQSLGNYTPNITAAVRYLESQMRSILDDPYALSIVNFALQLAGSNTANIASTKLEALAVVGNGTKHWTKAPEIETQTFGKYVWEYRLPAKDIEMTAYALMSAIRKRDIEGGYPILAWLLTKRNQQGGFQSSQDTVVGLNAISEFAQLVQSTNRDISVHIATAGGYQKDLTITDVNALVLQNAEPDKFYESVQVSATGKGTSLVQVSWIYYVRNTSGDQNFAVTTTVQKGKGSITLQVCTTYDSKSQADSNMAVMEISMPSGYQADEEEAKKLHGVIPDLARVDVEDEGTKVNIYFDKVSKTPPASPSPASGCSTWTTSRTRMWSCTTTTARVPVNRSSTTPTRRPEI